MRLAPCQDHLDINPSIAAVLESGRGATRRRTANRCDAFANNPRPAALRVYLTPIVNPWFALRCIPQTTFVIPSTQHQQRLPLEPGCRFQSPTLHLGPNESAICRQLIASFLGLRPHVPFLDRAGSG